MALPTHGPISKYQLPHGRNSRRCHFVPLGQRRRRREPGIHGHYCHFRVGRLENMKPCALA
jgi:hypothetical protein